MAADALTTRPHDRLCVEMKVLRSKQPSEQHVTKTVFIVYEIILFYTLVLTIRTLNDFINIQTAGIRFNKVLLQFLPLNTTHTCKLNDEAKSNVLYTASH